jgi:hypothetical protein
MLLADPVRVPDLFDKRSAPVIALARRIPYGNEVAGRALADRITYRGELYQGRRRRTLRAPLKNAALLLPERQADCISLENESIKREASLERSEVSSMAERPERSDEKLRYRANMTTEPMAVDTRSSRSVKPLSALWRHIGAQAHLFIHTPADLNADFFKVCLRFFLRIFYPVTGRLFRVNRLITVKAYLLYLLARYCHAAVLSESLLEPQVSVQHRQYSHYHAGEDGQRDERLQEREPFFLAYGAYGFLMTILS